MIEKMIIVTNNPMTKEKCPNAINYDLEFIQGDVLYVFKKVRDYIHKGHRLLTHPLMSSIKPNEIPYRTVLISRRDYDYIDEDSLNLIENSIHTTEKFLRDFNIPNWSEGVLCDFQVIDYDLIHHVLDR